MTDIKQNDGESSLVCIKCGMPLKPRTATLGYLGHKFSLQVPQCPECGQIYLTEELVRGKISEVEESLEDK